MWQEYIADQFFCAVLCTKCETNAGTCKCSKKLWIDEQKFLNGDKTIEAPYTCYYCKSKIFDRLCQLTDDYQTVDICRKCIQNI